MAVAITVTNQSSDRRIKIDITGAPEYAYVTRINSVTGEVVAVRGASPLRFIGGAATVYDYEGPRDVPVKYNVLNATSASVTLNSLGKIFFINPFDPDEFIDVEVIDKPSLDTESRTVVTQPIGAMLPVATTQTLPAPTSDMEVLANTLPEVLKYRKLLRGGAKFLYAPPAIVDEQCYVALTGSAKETRADPRKPNDVGRIFSFTIATVRGPAIYGSEQWTLAALARRFLTLDDAEGAYATLDDMRDDVLL